MKRLMKAALALLLAMALTLVACDPKVDEPEPRHGEPLWREKPITVDNAVADIREYFDDIEDSPYGIYLSSDLAILNLVGRPLVQLDKAALIAKLTGSDLTAAFEDDGDLILSETLDEDMELDNGRYMHQGVYNMIQDAATGDWSISVSRPDDAKWGFEATLSKDKEHGCFVSEDTERKDPRNHSKETFYPSVCAYNEVVLKSESVRHSKVNKRTEDGQVKEVDRKNIQTTTLYFADKNIGDGNKIYIYEYTEFEDEVKLEAGSGTTIFGHDKNGISVFKMIGKQTYPEDFVEYNRKVWFPASDGQLQIPQALRDIGIPNFTIKAGSFFTTFDDLNQTFDAQVNYDQITNKPTGASCYFTITNASDDVKTMILDAKDKDGQPVFREAGQSESLKGDYVSIAPSAIRGFFVSSDSTIDIWLQDDPATEANELDPFVPLVD